MTSVHGSPAWIKCALQGNQPAARPPAEYSHVAPRILDPPGPLWSNQPMSQGRILALDYGEKNVGLACTDELGLLVRPLPSIPNKGRRSLVARLRSVVKENDVACVVVGLPWNMDGTLGPAAGQVRAFIQLLQGELKLPLREVDERLSTMEAAELWKSMNRRQQRRYRTADSLAAALILQRYLEEK